eukprot:5324918-Karenia_brevis.AAC.1
MARILSVEVHEDIVNWFQTELDRDALHGHNKVTVDQIHKADMGLFLRSAELCKEDLSVRTDNSFPLDGIMKTVMLEPRILAL